MAVERELAEVMNDTVTLTPPSVFDNYAKRLPGITTSELSVKGRVMWDKSLAQNPDTREFVTTGRVILVDAYPQVSPDWVLTLPDGRKPQILGVATYNDEAGVAHHTTVRFGAR